MKTIPLKFSKRLRSLRNMDVGRHIASPTPSTTPTSPAANPAPQPASPSIATLLEDLHEKLNEFESRRQQSIAEMQAVSIELAFAALAKVLKAEIDRDQFPIEGIVNQMLQEYSSNATIRVHLHPADCQLLTATLKENDKQPLEMELIADREMARGGCRMESDGESLVHNLRLSITEMYRSVLEELDEPAIERRQSETAHGRLQRFPDRRSAS